MHTSISRNRLATILGRAAAVTFLAAAGTLSLHAQQSAGTAPALSTVNLKAYPLAPLGSSSSNDYGYTSSVGAAETANAELFNFGGAEQPPPRRRYSRPNYHDSRTNADGSSKYFFFGGGGFGVPTGSTSDYLNLGWGLQVGGGRNFNKKFGLGIEFDYDHFGLPTSTLNDVLTIYNNPPLYANFTQLGGNNHIWSFSFDPRYTFYDGDKYGAYVVGVVGFYHKVTSFTIPSVGYYYDPYYGYIQYQANQQIDSYTSNAPGFGGGLGMTYKFSRFSIARFYAEARYVYINNSARSYSLGDAQGRDFNVFPQNSQTTGYVPVKFGIRF
jgi:hypothetical protein